MPATPPTVGSAEQRRHYRIATSFEIGESDSVAADMDPRLWDLFNRHRTPR